MDPATTDSILQGEEDKLCHTISLSPVFQSLYESVIVKLYTLARNRQHRESRRKIWKESAKIVQIVKLSNWFSRLNDNWSSIKSPSYKIKINDGFLEANEKISKWILKRNTGCTMEQLWLKLSKTCFSTKMNRNANLYWIFFR